MHTRGCVCANHVVTVGGRHCAVYAMRLFVMNKVFSNSNPGRQWCYMQYLNIANPLVVVYVLPQRTCSR